MLDVFGSFPPNASSFGPQIDGLIRLITWVVMPWFLLAEGVLLWFLLRYRRRAGVRAAWVPGDTSRSNAWVLVPAALVLLCDLLIEGASVPVWREIKEELPGGDTVVRIRGQQFKWVFTYPGADGRLDTPDDWTSVDELHVPLGKVVRFELEAADVLHSFWVPELRLKQDAVPGRRFEGWFEPTAAGTYTIACAELCGTAHTRMKGTLRVLDDAAYRAWADARQGS